MIPDAEYGNSLKEVHHFTAPIHLQTVTVTKLYTYELKQVIKLQNNVLVWNVTDWNALSSLESITTGSYLEIVDQYTEQ